LSKSFESLDIEAISIEDHHAKSGAAVGEPLVVELIGLEPTTSALQGRRSPS
jgi:hypothetical protein